MASCFTLVPRQRRMIHTEAQLCIWSSTTSDTAAEAYMLDARHGRRMRRLKKNNIFGDIGGQEGGSNLACFDMVVKIGPFNV